MLTCNLREGNIFRKFIEADLGKVKAGLCHQWWIWKINHQFRIWLKHHYPHPKELEKQRTQITRLTQQPKISILCPVYNTPERYLRECIDSVLKQSYENWELCLVDDASEDSRVRSVIRGYSDSDSRVKFSCRNARGHISKASNDALHMATGDFVGFLDHDDFLWPDALYQVVKVLSENPKIKFIYSDEDKLSEAGKHIDPFFKPDWSPHYLRSRNYMAHFTVIERSLIEEVGGFREGFEGAQDWDLFLRVTRVLDSSEIFHIPKILYSWRQWSGSAALPGALQDVKAYAYVNQKKVLEEDLKARGYEGEAIPMNSLKIWRVRHKITGQPLVSMIIPTRNHYGYVKKCLSSILEKTTYRSFELVIVDTGSTEQNVFELYEEVKRRWKRTRVIPWKEEFNFSRVCNEGARQCDGDYLLLLNNDTEVLTPDWIEGMLEYAQLPEVGAVGALLLYPNGRIQHAGVVLGMRGKSKKKGVAGHAYRGSRNAVGMRGMLVGVRNFSAVTAACLMVKKQKYFEVGGQDPIFKIAFGDVDLNLKLLKAGYFNVYTGFVQLLHDESVSVKRPGSKERDWDQFRKEAAAMHERWGPLLQNDPFYNKNLTLDREDFSLNLHKQNSG